MASRENVQYKGVGHEEKDGMCSTVYSAKKKTPTMEHSEKYILMRNVQTLVMLLASLGIGLTGEITGTTLVYLKQRIGVNYEEISRSLIAESCGQITGQLLAAALFEKIPQFSNMLLSIGTILCGCIAFFIPWSPTLVILAILHFGNGTTRGFIISGSNSRLFQIWREKATIPTYLLHIFAGVGFLIVPQITRPFLPAYNPEPQPSNSSIYSQDFQIHQNGTSLPSGNASASAITNRQSELNEEHIEYPYIIIGVYCVIVGLLAFILHWFVKHYLKNTDNTAYAKNDNMTLDWSHMTPTRKVHVCSFMFLFILLWTLGVGIEKSVGRFLFSFATESQLQLQPQRASNLLMIFWISFTSSRILAAVVSIWVNPLKLLVVSALLSIANSAVLLTMADTNQLTLWICSALFSASIAPIFPSSITCLNKYIHMTPSLVTLAFMAATVGNIGFTSATGILFDRMGPTSLIAIMFIYSNVVLVVLLAIYLIAYTCPVVKKSGITNTLENPTL